MKELNFKKEVKGDLEPLVGKLTEELKKLGFGILTRIDFHTKMKEKLDKDIRPVVILGACNPQLAYEAFSVNTDVTSLIPCNAVIRETGVGKYSVELTSPSALMEVLGEKKLARMACKADDSLREVLSHL